MSLHRRFVAMLISLVISGGYLSAALASPSENANIKAGFECNKAVSKIEHSICSDDKLARADKQLNANYQKLLLLIEKSDAVELTTNQAAWLKGRDKYCAGSDIIITCIQDAYQRRNELLSKWRQAAEYHHFKDVYSIEKNPSLIPLKPIPEEPWRSLERYRIIADFNNDGIEDIALSYETSGFGNAGGHFSLYVGLVAGGFKELGYFFAHPRAINLKRLIKDEGIITTYARSNAGSGYLLEERITSAGIFMVSRKKIQPGDTGVPEDEALYSELFWKDGMRAEISETKDNTVTWKPLN